MISPVFIHRAENHWDDCETFNPDNFTSERTARRHPYAYVPFSAGARNCIGASAFCTYLERLIVHRSTLRAYGRENRADDVAATLSSHPTASQRTTSALHKA